LFCDVVWAVKACGASPINKIPKNKANFVLNLPKFLIVSSPLFLFLITVVFFNLFTLFDDNSTRKAAFHREGSTVQEDN
jgi:hypothetical protein